jgi:hypothetical protein
MYKEIKGNQRMTDNEASELYRDSYIIIRMDSIESDMGTVLFVGDNEKEMEDVLTGLEDNGYCGIVEGVNLMDTMGGLVVVTNG